MQLSDEERRALAIILGLLVLTSLARWVERPRTLPLLADAQALDIAALEEQSRAIRPAGRAAASQAAGPVDLNTASAKDLERLPGVGPALAGRIVEERSAGGPFASLGEVRARVKGIGPAMIGKWEGKAIVAGAAPADPAGTGTAAAPSGSASNATPAVVAGATATRAAAPGPGPAAGAAVMAAVDLNRASRTDLEKISGVGPILAGRLVGRRDSLGGFRDWAEVDAVPGVGPAMLARLKGLAVLGQ